MLYNTHAGARPELVPVGAVVGAQCVRADGVVTRRISHSRFNLGGPLLLWTWPCKVPSAQVAFTLAVTLAPISECCDRLRRCASQ